MSEAVMLIVVAVGGFAVGWVWRDSALEDANERILKRLAEPTWKWTTKGKP